MISTTFNMRKDFESSTGLLQKKKIIKRVEWNAEKKNKVRKTFQRQQNKRIEATNSACCVDMDHVTQWDSNSGAL